MVMALDLPGRLAARGFRAGFRFRGGGAATDTVDSNIEALIIRIGFGEHCSRNITRNPQNSIGNYLGPLC